MPTQNEAGIEFSLVPDENRQHFRLLELPAELLDVITGDNAQILQLKSQEANAGTLSGQNAVICTPDRTYGVRQVSTSNTVYVVQPSNVSGDNLSGPGIEAIAQCTSTLELQPETKSSALPYINHLVPTFTSTGLRGPGNSISKQLLFSQIPLSVGECQQAWLDLACFEDGGEALQPSDSVKLQAWHAILNAAIAQGINLSQPLGQEGQAVLIDNESEWPSELSAAILRSVCSPGSKPGAIDIDGDRLARFLGFTLLKDRTNDGRTSISSTAFQAAWQDLLPEMWRGKAELSLLEGNVRGENNGADIVFFDGAAQNIASGASAPTGPKSSLGAKRKWHEKFRSSKKTS